MKKVVAAIVGIAIVALMGWTHRDQIEVRFNCAGKLAAQSVTQTVVKGAWECIDPNMKYFVNLIYDINDAQSFAKAWGAPDKYHVTYTYLGKTNDGGYTFRFDVATYPHNSYSAAWDDVKSGDLKGAFSELNGETQGWQSLVETIYLYPAGTVQTDIQGQTHDFSGQFAGIA